MRAHDERAFMRARVRRAYARRYLTRRQSGIVMGHMRADHRRAHHSWSFAEALHATSMGSWWVMRAHDERAFMRARVRRAYMRSRARRCRTRRRSGAHARKSGARSRYSSCEVWHTILYEFIWHIIVILHVKQSQKWSNYIVDVRLTDMRGVNWFTWLLCELIYLTGHDQADALNTP